MCVRAPVWRESCQRFLAARINYKSRHSLQSIAGDKLEFNVHQLAGLGQRVLGTA